jgi:hypothetical protein
MKPGITDIASYLAARIPTGKDDEAAALQDWRMTLYNAKATNAIRPLTDMVVREIPEDRLARDLCASIGGKAE